MSEATRGLRCPKCGHGNLMLSGKRKIVSQKEPKQQYHCPNCGTQTRYPKGVLLKDNIELENVKV